MIDPTITIGNIIEISTIVGGGVIAGALLKATVANLGREVKEMKIDIKALNTIVVEMAVADRRLIAVEEDIRELRHGKGFIRDSIQGEWPK